jgi:hypothetical protein
MSFISNPRRQKRLGFVSDERFGGETPDANLHGFVREDPELIPFGFG